MYYYTGTNEEVANNFIWYGGHQWRVLEFDTEDDTLMLITQQPVTSIMPAREAWDSKYSYESSYVNTWLNEYFWSSLDSSIQNNILDNTFNVGVYDYVSEITTIQKVGLLDEVQYKRAGGANSFLDIKQSILLGNRHNKIDLGNQLNHIRFTNESGDITYSYSSFSIEIRAVIKISDFNVSNGNGTLSDNYRNTSKSTNTNNVQVGEYINVPYSGSDNACGNDNLCTFRVVSKDNDSIKVVLNGLLADTSIYGSSTTINTSYTIYETLNEFSKGINDKYRYMGNKIFYIGEYSKTSSFNLREYGNDYKDIQDETIEASVGLPTVGDMFTCDDIDLRNKKIYVTLIQ